MIVTLCGSTRFEQDFIDAQRELSRRGILCFSLAVLPQHRKEGESWSDGQFDKTMADLLYFSRIMHSDAILVLGDGYIGPSTSREILWAKIQNKRMIQQWWKGIDDWDFIARRLQSEDDSVSLVELAKATFQRGD